MGLLLVELVAVVIESPWRKYRTFDIKYGASAGQQLYICICSVPMLLMGVQHIQSVRDEYTIHGNWGTHNQQLKTIH